LIYQAAENAFSLRGINMTERRPIYFMRPNVFWFGIVPIAALIITVVIVLRVGLVATSGTTGSSFDLQGGSQHALMLSAEFKPIARDGKFG
jgi:hypothetical protein